MNTSFVSCCDCFTDVSLHDYCMCIINVLLYAYSVILYPCYNHVAITCMYNDYCRAMITIFNEVQYMYIHVLIFLIYTLSIVECTVYIIS